LVLTRGDSYRTAAIPSCLLPASMDYLAGIAGIWSKRPKRKEADEPHRAADASAKKAKPSKAVSGKLRMPDSSAVQMLGRTAESECDDAHASDSTAAMQSAGRQQQPPQQADSAAAEAEVALLTYDRFYTPQGDSFAEQHPSTGTASFHSAGSRCTVRLPSGNSSGTTREQWSGLSRASLSSLEEDDADNTDQDATASNHSLTSQFLEACCATEVVSALSKLEYAGLLPVSGTREFSAASPAPACS
jgi:hypothetical protein